MPRLLAAQRTAVLFHIFVDVLVAHLRLSIIDALTLQRLIEAEVGHHRRHHRVVDELAALLHVLAAEIEDVIAVDDLPLFIHAEAAVGVAVKGKSDIEPFLLDELLQPFDVRGARIAVDVQPVRLRIDDIRRRPERFKDRPCDAPGGAVRAIETDLEILEGIQPQRDEVRDVAVSSRGVIDRLADVIARCEGKFFLAVEVFLDQGNDALLKFFALSVEDLDAVVVKGVVARGDHDPAVEIIHARDIRNGGRRRDVQHIGIRPRRRDPGNERIFKHIARTAGILADDDARTLAAFLLLPVIPAQKAADLIGMICREPQIGFPAEAVRSKIFSHTLSYILRSMSHAQFDAAHYLFASM